LDEGPNTKDLIPPPPSTFQEAISVASADPDLLRRFLIEQMAPQERAHFERRWRATCLLLEGHNRNKVSEIVGLDPKTVGRIARWVIGDQRAVKQPQSTLGASEEVYSLIRADLSIVNRGSQEASESIGEPFR
jgi:hypothetical protein